MLPFARYIRAWVEVDGHPVEPCALYENIQVSETSVQLVFPSASGAKLDAVLLGRKFVCTEFKDTTLLEGVANKSGKKLKDRLGKSEYLLPVSEFDSSNVKILAVKPNGAPIQVVLGKQKPASGEAFLWVNEDLSFQCSDEVLGCNLTIHCPIYYPEVVLMSEEEFSSLRLHLIGRDGGGLLLYAGMDAKLQPNKVPGVGELKILKLEIDTSAMRLEAIGGSKD